MDLFEIDLSDIEGGAWVKIPCRRTVEVSEALIEASTDMKRYRAEQFNRYIKMWWRGDRPTVAEYRQLDEWLGAAMLDRAHKHYETHMPVRDHVDVRFTRDFAELAVRAFDEAGTDAEERSALNGLSAQLRAFVEEGEEGKA